MRAAAVESQGELRVKILTRYLVWAPLLIVALAISYVLGESLQRGPCPGERTGWVAGNLVAAAFALYFLVGYWVVVTRKYLVMAILTVWAWHLLAVSPVLRSTCSEQKGLDRLHEALGFGFREFVIALALLATASSVALFLRYRKSTGSPARDPRTSLRLFVAGAAGASIALTVGVYWMVPLLRDAFANFGAELPQPTFLLVDTYQYWIVLLLACVAGVLYLAMKRQYTDGQLRIALNGALGLIILVNVLAGAVAFTTFLPVLQLCACV
jgi:hypothetical protein